jgi:ubiquitin conjugation factor E4 B
MLNYYLYMLNGEKCKNLIIKNPEKYQWNPKILLSEIVNIYCNFKDYENFYISLVNDERSYNIDIFNKTIQNLKKIEKNQTEIKIFQQIINKTKEQFEIKKKEDEFFGDDDEIPDEFKGIFINIKFYIQILK